MSNENTNPEKTDFDKNTDEILAIIKSRSIKKTALPIELCQPMEEIRRRSLYLSETDELGKPIFPTYDNYIKWLAKKAREVLRKEPGKFGHRSTGYKVVNEMLVYNRLAENTSDLPINRAQLQKLEELNGDKQLPVWLESKKIAAGKNITERTIFEAAVKVGEKVSPPSQSASSKFKLVRDAWIKFKAAVIMEFGSPIERHLTTLDALLAKQDKSDSKPADKGKTHEETPEKEDSNKKQSSGPSITGCSENPKAALNLAAAAKHEPNLPQHPFAILYNDEVVISFSTQSQYNQYQKAGFPKLFPSYKYDGSLLGGSWHRAGLSAIEQANERSKYEKLLAEIGAKLSPKAA